jgi:hypothetical protein
MQHPYPLKSVMAMILISGLAMLATPASADGFNHIDTNAVLGGALGGGAGAAVGSAVGGRNGAMVGSAVGAVAGVAIATPQQHRRDYGYRDDYDEHDRGWHRGHRHHHHHEHDD